MSKRKPHPSRHPTPRITPLYPIAVALLSLAAAVTLLLGSEAQARITKVVITATELPTFSGYSWSGVGRYEKAAR